MRNKIAFIIISIVFLFTTSCSEQSLLEEKALKESSIQVQNEILGIWSNVDYVTDSTRVYRRLNDTPDDNYFLQILPYNQLKEHKNIGWCGTPPVSYGIYEGDWSIQDSIITIKVPYWGGMTYSQWKILKVDEKQLKVKIIKEESKEK